MAVVVVQVLYDAGQQSERENLVWKLRFGFIAAATLLVVGIWNASWLVAGTGAVLGWLWIEGARDYRRDMRADTQLPP